MSEREEPQMTMLAPEPVRDGDASKHSREDVAEQSKELFAMLDSLPESKRWRAESLDGETIILSPTPIGLHGRNVRELQRQFTPHMPEGIDYETQLEIRMPDSGRSVIPDFFLAAEGALETEESWVLPDDVLLAAEVVSRGSAQRDREDKRRVYATAGIAVYLLVDPLQQRTTVFAGPKGDDYQDSVSLRFGAEISIPEPFEFGLETKGFHAY
ncbi:Uma2 family endonuclease [Salinactinospora qingdaonensis]|uniref:Uma2 family endonuclease n=1 Tax=Salinactinospora qingdaonensis TaxID=702744 RepID=A0ABP7FIX3_9ACTN